MTLPQLTRCVSSALPVCLALSTAFAPALAEEAVEPPNPVIEQLLSVLQVGDPVVSPDGKHVVYSVSSRDAEADSYQSDLWLVASEGGEPRQLTHSAESEHSPQWLADGSAVLFLSDRHAPEEGEAQIWRLPLAGGEARRLTDIAGGIEDYHASAGGEQAIAVVPQPDPFAAQEGQTPPPVVIDRYAFKQDGVGYLVAGRGFQWVNLETGEARELAVPGFDIARPAISPDGTRVAYVAKAGPHRDARINRDVYVFDVDRPEGARVVAATEDEECPDHHGQRPQWHPRGTHIACVSLASDTEGYYAQSELVLLDVEKGTVRRLTDALDLNIGAPRFDADGSSIWFSLEDDMTVQLARLDLASGEIRRALQGPRSVESLARPGRDGTVVLRISDEATPAELFVLRGGALSRLTAHNDRLLQQRPWVSAERLSYPSADGTRVHALLLRPSGVPAERRLPLVLWLHGGPTSQFAHEARLDPQLFAAHGYAVLMPNPRGSTGRGLAYSKAIWAAWGSVDVADVLAGVDYLVQRGDADPERLAVGGWSYGGMLTNFVIASDTRFKAAASGAAISNVWAGFGTDQYIREYLLELGAPWDNAEAWDRVSYPFLRANRIRTPTLFMSGEQDYNVPLLATEQMYQALRVLDVPTQMVIYPGQSHGLAVPSYNADRWQRYLDWFARYL